jgi:hypothetical protein
VGGWGSTENSKNIQGRVSYAVEKNKAGACVTGLEDGGLDFTLGDLGKCDTCLDT